MIDGPDRIIDGWGKIYEGLIALYLRKPILDMWEGHVSCIEPAIGSTGGVPDCYLAEHPIGGWVEFKVANDKGDFKLEPSQRLWLRSSRAHIDNVAICALDKEGIWLFHAHLAIDVAENVYKIGAKKVRLPSLTPALLRTLCREAWCCGK